MNEILQAILTRRSVRRFLPEQISDEALAAILEAGTYAPSSRGQQRCFIVAVQREALRQRLAAINARYASNPTADPFFGAPTHIYVFAPADYPFGLQDGSAIMQNLLLATHSLGLGGCWINRCVETFATAEGKAIMSSMGLPEGLQGVAAVALGFPAIPASKAKPRKADYTRVIV
ncbi:MAG: nitroreductase [Bacteroidales bacterium]|nr:nitroreductase [Bacteroidales bacterium]